MKRRLPWVLLLLVTFVLLGLWTRDRRRLSLEQQRLKASREQSFALEKDHGRELEALRREQANNQRLRRENLQLRRRTESWEPYINSAFFRGQVPEWGAPEYVRVAQTSHVPAPAASPYAECLVACRLQRIGKGGLYGPVAGSATNECVGLFWAFRDRKPSPGMEYKEGDLLTCYFLPPEKVAEDIRQIQVADDIGDPQLPVFYAARDLRAPAEEPVLREIPPPPPAPSREDAIASELRRIRAMVERNGGSYSNWIEKTSAVRAGLVSRVEREGELLIDGRISYTGIHGQAPPPPGWPEHQVQVLSSMNRQMAQRGIDLIVAPFPFKDLVNAPFFTDEFGPDAVAEPWRYQMFEALLEAGIETIDLLPGLRAAWQASPRVYYNAVDSHPAEGALRVTARAIGERLARYSLPRDLEKVWTQEVGFAIPRQAKFDAFPESAKTGTPYAATRIFAPDGSPVLDWGRPGAPVLLLCDSFGGVPDRYGVGAASLLPQIARETGIIAEKIERGGGGPQMMKFLSQYPPETFRNRKVCLLVINEPALLWSLEWVDAVLPGP